LGVAGRKKEKKRKKKSRVKLETSFIPRLSGFLLNPWVWDLTFSIRDWKLHRRFDGDKKELIKDFRYQTPGYEFAVKKCFPNALGLEPDPVSHSRAF
jgi:hypothetical protein